MNLKFASNFVDDAVELGHLLALLVIVGVVIVSCATLDLIGEACTLTKRILGAGAGR